MLNYNMACLTIERRTELEERLTKKETQLTKLYEAFDNFDGVKEYRFQSAETMQQTKFSTIKEIQDMITIIEAQIDRINRQLGNTGLKNIVLRRKGYYGSY